MFRVPTANATNAVKSTVTARPTVIARTALINAPTTAVSKNRAPKSTARTKQAARRVKTKIRRAFRGPTARATPVRRFRAGVRRTATAAIRKNA